MTSHPYKTSQAFDGSSDTSGTTSEEYHKFRKKITVTIWWTNKETIKCKECDHQKSASREKSFKRKAGNLENKVTSFEINQNKLEQYGRKNSIEVSGIPDAVEDNCLEEKLFLCLPVLASM